MITQKVFAFGKGECVKCAKDYTIFNCLIQGEIKRQMPVV
jgi:hypothetical protein